MHTPHLTRNRIIYVFIIIVVIALGLASRRYPELLPHFLARYAGDTLWALLVFLLLGLLFPTMSTLKVAIIALLLAWSIEISQLYHAPWLDEIRHYWLGALVLGHGFIWSDIICYTVGITIGVIGELLGSDFTP